MHVFYCNSSLKDIIIPPSVTSIGMGAFQMCSSLKEINIPYSVTEIGENAFYGCYSLNKITIPSCINKDSLLINPRTCICTTFNKPTLTKLKDFFANL